MARQPENELQYVGRYLVLLRRRKMKQVELAEKLGVAQSQISKWERANYSYVNLELVARAAQALGVGLDTSFKDWVIAWSS
jgi:transcriptional regulator with XRE-family HTH domain